jgi:hypothetical protein
MIAEWVGIAHRASFKAAQEFQTAMHIGQRSIQRYREVRSSSFIPCKQ